jgi:IS605 OrfB family transposase
MGKKKKKNIVRALELKQNIKKYKHFVNLPLKKDIITNKNNNYCINPKTNKIQPFLISGINTNYFNSNNIKSKLKLQSDDLIEGRPLKDILVKTKRILLKPTSEQKNTLLTWMDAWIVMYNKVLSVIKAERKAQSEVLNKSIQYNQMNLDNLKLGKLKKDLQHFKDELNNKTGIDKHVLDNCIDTVLSMLKSSITNIIKGNCKKSKLRYIKKTKKSKIFKVEYHSLRDKSFCTSKFGEIIQTIPNVNFKKVNNCITTIQYKNDKFYMLAKKKIVIEKHPIKKQKVISLDPGQKTFLTGLSNDHLIEIGNKIDKKIKEKLNKMDKIKERKAKNKRKHLLKHEKDLSNYINNLHWQTANYLTTNYNHILLGNYSTKEMVENDKSNKMNKRIGSSFKFYQFRIKLKYKCLLRGCKFGLIDEYNTTKACSNCSNLNNIGASREYNCKYCLNVYSRDMNSCKNILLRGIID